MIFPSKSKGCKLEWSKIGRSRTPVIKSLTASMVTSEIFLFVPEMSIVWPGDHPGDHTVLAGGSLDLGTSYSY